jgi:hypothetical protein
MRKRCFFGHLLVLLFPVVLQAAGDDPTFTVVEEGNKKGLYDENGKLLIPIRYDDLGWSAGEPLVYHKVIGFREGARWGLIDVQNQRICPPLFDWLMPHQDKLLVAGQKKGEHLKYGLVNVKGEQALAFRYASLRSHAAQLIASVAKAQRLAYGLINSEGEALIGFEYAAIRPVAADRYAVRHELGQEALFSAEGEVLTPFRYDSIAPFEHGLAVTYRQGKQGVIDQSGAQQVANQYQQVRIASRRSVSVLPFDQWQAYTSANQLIETYSFDDLQPVGINLYRAKIGSSGTYVNSTGEVIIPEQWSVVRLSKSFAVITDHQKYGVLSNRPGQEKQVIVPMEYDSVRIDGDFVVAGKRSLDRHIPTQQALESKTNFNWELFDAQGTLLSTYVYQAVGALHERRFAVKRKNHWGYLDPSGQEVIACQYQSVTPFDQGRASVTFQEGPGVIDTVGRWVVKPLHRGSSQVKLERISENVYVFSPAELPTEGYHASALWGLIDQQGREVYQTNHQLINNGNSFWERSDDGHCGLISYSGRRLLETRYDTVSALQEGKIYTYRRKGQFGILSWDGRELLDLNNDFEELHPMSDGFLGVRINGKYGFVDDWGRLRIANRYDSVTHFSSNLAAVKVMGHWGYIDKAEHLVVQPRFDCAYPFQGAVALVKKDNKFGLVNTEGRTVVPPVYDQIEITEAGRYLLYLNDPKRGMLMGLVSEVGEPLIHPKYESVKDLNNGFAMVGRNGKYGLLTTKGRPTIPMVHSRLIHDPYNEIYFSVTSPAWQTIKLDADL